MQNRNKNQFYSLSAICLMILCVTFIQGCTTGIINASYDGNIDRVKELIDEGIDVNTDFSGVKPLHNAAMNGHIAIVKLLIENGANVNAATNQGVTPLHNAAASGHVNIVKLLTDNGANVNAVGNNGFTALHNASFYGHGEVVELLLKAKANVNVKTKIGDTPLKLASSKGHIEIVNLLKPLQDFEKENLAIRRYDDLISKAGSLNTDKTNENIREIKTYLRDFPQGKYANLFEELIQYYAAEQTPSKKAFEEYLKNWPNGKFEKWAKDSLVFINSEEVSDHLLAKVMKEADRILRQKIKQEVAKLSKTHAINLKKTNRSLETRILGGLNQMGIVDEHAVIFEGSLKATLNSSSESVIYYSGKVTVDEVKFRFILKYKMVTEPYFDIVPGSFNLVLQGSTVIMNHEQYFYNGHHWIKRLIGPFFFNNSRALDD